MKTRIKLIICALMALSPANTTGPRVWKNRSAFTEIPSSQARSLLNSASSVVIALLFICLLSAWQPALAEESETSQLNVQFDDQGVTNIEYAGAAMLADGIPRIRSILLETVDKPAGWEYTFEEADLSEPQIEVDSQGQHISYIYPWGEVHWNYRAEGDRLVIDMTLDNHSNRAVANFEVKLLELQFPSRPQGRVSHFGQIENSLDKPGYLPVVYGDHKVLICADTIFPPLQLGLDKATNEYHTRFPVLTRGGLPAMEPDGVFFHPHGLPRVEAGDSATFTFSLRFAPAERPDHQILEDLHAAFADYWEPTLEWEDNRYIGALFLPTGGEGTPGNPRNWFKMDDVDVQTEEGLAKLRQRLMNYADNAIETLESMDAQGMIVWNIEGGENPHPVTYIGDPRMLPIMAPEMDELADEFFQKFRDAGLRTGVTIRPPQVYQREDGRWFQGTGSHGPDRNPLGESYDEIWPKHLLWWRFFPVVERMNRKIQYAKDRWGCTIFYVDTNGVRPPFQGGDRFRAHGSDFTWVLLDGHVWRRIAEAHPDVLLIPELRQEEWTFHANQWAYTVPYEQMDYTGHVGSPERVRRIFPASRVANYLANTGPEELEERHEELLEAVRNGNIFMGRGWFNDSQNKRIRPVYEEAFSE